MNTPVRLGTQSGVLNGYIEVELRLPINRNNQ